MDETEGDVVCVGIVPRGQTVDWSPGGFEPDPAEWVSEAAFVDMLRAAAEARVPILPAVDLYAQTRISPADCKCILQRWSGLEAALRGTRAEAPTDAIGRLMRTCADHSNDVELLIEGP